MVVRIHDGFILFPNIKHKELRDLAELGRSLHCDYISSSTTRNTSAIFSSIKEITFPIKLLKGEPPTPRPRFMRWIN